MRHRLKKHLIVEQPPIVVIPVPPARHIIVKAADSGSGIRTGDVRKVFEPFFTTKLGSRRAGLGLSAIHGIVASHGGGIGIESAPGLGTRVRIYFPVLDPQPV